MKGWLISIVTFCLLYVTLEIFCLPIFFRYLSHGAYPFLGEGVSFALQRTKKSVMPENYVAIVGDSYAQGLGDEYYEGNHTASAEYGSAPFLYKALKQDVISFGTAGNSSISAMVTQPVLAQKFFNKSWRTSLEAPEKILVYFYEGNDFSDNIEYFRYTKKRVVFDQNKSLEPGYFEHYIHKAAIDTHPWNQKIENMQWYDQLYLAKFVGKAAPILVASLFISGGETAESEQSVHDSPLNIKGRFGWKAPGTTNQVFVKGVVTHIPDKLQVPSSLSLNEDEKKLSLQAYQESLRWMKKFYPESAITVIYLPSVISTYHLASAEVYGQHFRKEEGGRFSAEAVRQQSDWGEQNIRALTEAEGVDFIDARPVMLEASKTKLLHGPHDWNHLNREGYRALAEAILQEIHSP